MAHTVHFEVTNQSGNLFSHSEKFHVVGLARVRVREIKEDKFVDWSGICQRYVARSSRPFVVVVVSDHGNEGQNGEWVDHSEVVALHSEETASQAA